MENFLLPENFEIYNDFIKYYEPRVSSQGYQTIKHQSRSVIKWFDNRNIRLTEVTLRDVMEYKKDLNELKGEKKLNPGSKCNRIKMGRKLFRYMLKFEKVQTNPFLEVKYPRVPDNISKNILNEIQMNRLLETFSDFNNMDNYRLHVACVLLYATGMRIAEAAALLPGDIDVKRRKVIIRSGKGGKSRIAYLTGYAAEVLELYIRRARKPLLLRAWRKNGEKLFGADVAALLYTVNGGLKEICKILKIPVITCHGFRHSLGTHLLRAGCDLRHIQLILGHEKLSSTQRYTRVDRRELKNVIDMYHPRQPKKRSVCV